MINLKNTKAAPAPSMWKSAVYAHPGVAYNGYVDYILTHNLGRKLTRVQMFRGDPGSGVADLVYADYFTIKYTNIYSHSWGQINTGAPGYNSLTMRVYYMGSSGSDIRFALYSDEE